MKSRLALAFILAPFAAEAAGLVDYVVKDGASIPAPLAEWAGGPEPGAALYENAGCAACHDGPDAPDLAGADERLTAGEMRLMIVEPRIFFPGTAMPAYYTPGKMGEAPDEMVGLTRLSALEIEQIIAYLMRADTP